MIFISSIKYPVSKKWKESFLASQKGLELLAKEALVEYQSGRTKPLKY